MNMITVGRARAALTVGLGTGLLVFTARCSSSSNPGDDVTTADASDLGDAAGGDSAAPDGSEAAAMPDGSDAGAPDGGDAAPALDGGDAASADAGDAGPVAAEASSDASSDGPNDTGASIVDADLPDVSFYDAGDGGLCNSLANGAVQVQPTRVVGTLPVGTGGTVEQGLYYLTAVQEYVSADSGVDASGTTGPLRETVELISEGGNTFRGAVALEVNGGQGSFNASVTETYASNTADLTFTCNAPQAGPTNITYTFDTAVTPHQLHSFETNYSGQGIDAEFTLELQ
jgi:hypothetical protein